MAISVKDSVMIPYMSPVWFRYSYPFRLFHDHANRYSVMLKLVKYMNDDGKYLLDWVWLLVTLKYIEIPVGCANKTENPR